MDYGSLKVEADVNLNSCQDGRNKLLQLFALAAIDVP